MTVKSKEMSPLFFHSPGVTQKSLSTLQKQKLQKEQRFHFLPVIASEKWLCSRNTIDSMSTDNRPLTGSHVGHAVSPASFSLSAALRLTEQCHPQVSQRHLRDTYRNGPAMRLTDISPGSIIAQVLFAISSLH